MENKKTILFITIMIVIAALSRLLPHPHNFTPIGAIGLFGAAYFRPKWLAFIVPFAALWMSDLIIMNGPLSAFYDGFRWYGHIWVYASFAAIICIGFLWLRNTNVTNIIGASLTASLFFFLITNFGVWIGSVMYPQNIAGLMMSYTAGLPFFLSTLAGDLFYCGVLFGAYAWFKNQQLAREKA